MGRKRACRREKKQGSWRKPPSAAGPPPRRRRRAKPRRRSLPPSAKAEQGRCEKPKAAPPKAKRAASEGQGRAAKAKPARVSAKTKPAAKAKTCRAVKVPAPSREAAETTAPNRVPKAKKRVEDRPSQQAEPRGRRTASRQTAARKPRTLSLARRRESRRLSPSRKRWSRASRRRTLKPQTGARLERDSLPAQDRLPHEGWAARARARAAQALARDAPLRQAARRGEGARNSCCMTGRLTPTATSISAPG